jgi:DNA-binding CsgD family transcriptional regulator
LSLRDSDQKIRECLEGVFNKRRVVPSFIRNGVDAYSRLPDIELYLTHREIEVVRCIAEEKTAKKTASCLMVSEKTVTNHLASIYQKFGIRNKVGVLKLAVSKGIIPVDELMTYTVQS